MSNRNRAPIRSNFVSYQSPIFKKLSNDQLQELHFATLEILERTGVVLDLPEAVGMLKKAGAHVTDGNRVRLPSHLVEWALTTVPKRVVFCDQDGNRVMPLEGNKSFCGTGSDCLNILDHRTGKRRPAKLTDVIDAIKVCNSLPNIDFVMSTFLPWDLPQEKMHLHQMEVMLKYTKKPVFFVTPGFEGFPECIEMAEIIAGGPDELRRNPFVGCYINLAADLHHGASSIQKLLYMAEKGLPTSYTPTGNRGAMAPVTCAGAQVHMAAGNLTGLVLSQLKREGAPFIFGGWGLLMDMKTQIIPYAPPEMQGLGASQSHYYRLPYFGLSGCSDAKLLDGQATLDASLTLMADILSGSNLIHDLGYLESGLCASLPLLTICDEIVGWIKRFMDPIEVTPETLALDVIDEVGPMGHFISCDHTLRHFRDDFYPNLLDRQNYEGWQATGSKSIEERAKETVEEILVQPDSDHLEKGIREKIESIVKNYTED
jgi:trimethylamine--corrinoid protein Co-methyltransferase